MKLPRLLPLFAAAALAALAPLPAAEDHGKLIFQDDFARTESQEKTDEPGNGWGTNSKARAKGNKQVDLRDGAMSIYLSSEADHAVSVQHAADFTDGAVALRFKLDDARDSLGLDFADLARKDVHAGHLFAARVSPKQVLLQDLATGGMRLDIHTARKAKQKLSADQQQALVNKEKKIPATLALNAWHTLLVKISGDELSVTIDDRPFGTLKSPGIAHPTKKMLRLAVPRNAVVDDVKIWRKN
jgi:hypothetical protein